MCIPLFVPIPRSCNCVRKFVLLHSNQGLLNSQHNRMIIEISNARLGPKVRIIRMNRDPENPYAVTRSIRLNWPMRYGGALLSVGAAVAVSSLTGLMHRDPFAIFVFGVVAIARLLGFGPAVFGTALSVVAIHYIGFTPHFSMGINASD